MSEQSLNTIDVLIAVDVLAATTHGLGENVYMMDTSKYMGSNGEGQAELETGCKDGQIIRWTVQPVSPGTNIKILRFTGDAVNTGICNPKEVDVTEPFWEGRVESQGQSRRVQYSVVLSVNNQELSFDPFLEIKA